MIVWALFDSGNGCYTQGAELFNQSVSQSVNQSVKIYPIGIDIESRNMITRGWERSEEKEGEE